MNVKIVLIYKIKTFKSVNSLYLYVNIFYRSQLIPKISSFEIIVMKLKVKHFIFLSFNLSKNETSYSTGRRPCQFFA